MAIEFNCPYCSAVIRVPDSAGGGKGKCPRCARRITVPKVSPPKAAPKPTGDELQLFGLDESEELTEPTAAAGDDAVVFAAAEVEADPSAPFDFSAPRAIGQFPVDTARKPLAAGSISSKLKKKKSGGAWLIPMVFGLALCAVVGWFVWQQYQTERLVGVLTAESAAELELPPGEVSSGMFKQSPDEVKEVLETLERSPVRQPSSLMTIQIGASKRAMTFQVTPGPQTQFYRVDTSGDQPLINFRKNRTFELEQLRADEIEQAGTAFIDAYQKMRGKKVDGKSLSDFRNSLALPALVGGLGYQVEAVAGQTPYRCVYEDRDGGLYFLMPPGIQTFEIVGRKGQDGKTQFNGKYQVNVTGEYHVPEKATPADAKKGKMKESMDDDEKPEMKESMEEGEAKPKMDKMEKSQ